MEWCEVPGMCGKEQFLMNMGWPILGGDSVHRYPYRFLFTVHLAKPDLIGLSWIQSSLDISDHSPQMVQHGE